MSDASATRPIVVLDDDDGPRIVSLRARERNRRAAARAGAEFRGRGELDALPAEALALIVPSTVTFDPDLFSALPSPEAVASSPVRLASPGGGAPLLFGRVGALAALGTGEAGDALPAHGLPPGHAFDVATPAARKASTRALLRKTEKPTDGVVSRNLNRYISRFFSAWFLRFGITPNQASFVCLAIGLGSAALCAMTGWWTMALAGLLFQLASAFDGVDGEMARVTFTASPFGAWLDTAVDNATYLACLIGITVGWLREGPGTLGVVLGVALAVAVPAVLLVLLRFVRRYAPDGSMVFVDRTVERAAADTGRPSLRVARVLFYGLRRDIFAAVLCVLSLSGTRAAIPAAVAAGLVVALATFFAHWSRLVTAAQSLEREAAATARG